MAHSEYLKILETIFQKNREISDASSEKFQNLFVEDGGFRKLFYDYFKIAGGALVIADALEKRVVLLQDEVSDAKNYPKLNIPIRKDRTSKSRSLINFSALNEEEYNLLANKIFQIQRKNQGLYDHKNFVTFTKVPEFFKELPSSGDLASSSNYVVYNHGTMMYGFLIWRLLIWFLYKNFKENKDLQVKDCYNYLRSDSVENLNCTKTENYFTFPFLNKYFNLKSDPESSLQELDIPSNWKSHSANAHTHWQKIRAKVDRVKPQLSEEIDAIKYLDSPDALRQLTEIIDYKNNITDLNNEVVSAVFKHFVDSIGDNFDGSINSALDFLHKSNPIIVPYYYFCQIDGKLKEHFVFSIWHSPKHPISYYDEDGNLKKHTSVLNCMIALNEDLGETRKLELITAFKLISENVINSLFIEKLIRSEQRKDQFQFERNILLSSVKESPGIFLLGTNEERITFLAQQSRAINLIRALSEFKVLTQDKKIGIIGGGISGVTAAVACSYLGVKNINLFESDDDILMLQKTATHRFIHPYIYDWPSEIYEKDQAELPFLEWNADYTHSVLNQIRQQFYDSKLKIDLQVNVKIDDIKKSKQGYDLFANKKFKGHYDFLIMAIGYGYETNIFKSGDFQSYWKPDVLMRPFKTHTSVLVGGSGDGALIDLIRAKLKNTFDGEPINHKTIFDLTRLHSLRNLGLKMLEVDKKFAASQYLGENVSLREMYDANFKNDQEIPIALSDLKPFLRDDTVVYHASGTNQFNLNSSLLNRLIVYLLILDKQIESDRYTGMMVKNKKGKVVELSNSQTKTTDRISVDVSIFRFGTDKNFLKRSFPIFNGYNPELSYFRLNLTNYVSSDTIEWYKENMDVNK
ncbi:hypothetical protein MUGA111182_18145 [Mucilaginibacter galii]|uniref:Uncharacterized protein n=1 Tax=Mucilaginibacter galii TaxID=2005073 RepID=A0A917JEM8_9SPHI|nr:hypothetical protein [Mucilaginibacter galii]GGI52691.1 hypothetical protein GCM10011425_39030 [Mucilaginibacter galii]